MYTMTKSFSFWKLIKKNGRQIFRVYHFDVIEHEMRQLVWWDDSLKLIFQTISNCLFLSLSIFLTHMYKYRQI